MKTFFETFPTLRVHSDIRFLFEEVQVEAVYLVKSGNFMRIKVRGAESVAPAFLEKMQEEISSQVLNHALPVRFVLSAPEPVPAAETQVMPASEIVAEPAQEAFDEPVPEVSAEPAPEPPEAFYSDDYEYEYVSVPEISSGSSSAAKKSAYAPGGGGKGNLKKRYTAKKKGPDPGMLYGRTFSGTATELRDIIGEMKDCIIRGEIFDTELPET